MNTNNTKVIAILVIYLFLFFSITQNDLNQKQIEGNVQFMDSFLSNLIIKICLEIQSVIKSYLECMLQTVLL